MVTWSATRFLALTSLAVLPVMGACGGDDDDTTPPETEVTPTQVPVVETPTAIPETPTPTPEPEPAIFPLAISDYKTMSYGLFEFTTPLVGYQYVTWGGDISFAADGSTITGRNVWAFWLEGTEDPSAVPPSCIMPETYAGDLAAKVDVKAKGCSLTYDIAFQPLEDETTCPQELVEEWNGATNPYGEWEDKWSMWDVVAKGYPTDLADGADQYNEWGARFVIFTNWITGNPVADEIVVPPCSETLTTSCYPVVE